MRKYWLFHVFHNLVSVFSIPEGLRLKKKAYGKARGYVFLKKTQMLVLGTHLNETLL